MMMTRLRLAVVTLTLMLVAFVGCASAQQAVVVSATDSSTGARTQVGDNTNHALRVNIVSSTGAIRIADGAGNSLTSRIAGSSRPLEIVQLDGSGNIVTPSAGTGTSSNFTSSFPSAGTASGGTDGSNMQAFRMFDADTGAGTQYLQGVNLRISGSGGSIEAKGAQTSANSLPVVLASDEAALPVSQSGSWSVRAQDGAGNLITSASRGSERALTVQIVDGSGAQVTTFGGAGGTSSNYGSAFPSAGTALGFSDGTNMQGARVVDLDNSGGTFYGLATNLVKRTAGTPTELIGQATMANSLPVVFASDQTALLPGTGATNLGKAEDAAHTSSDVGVMGLAVRESTATDLSAGATNGDYEPLQVDATGRLWTNPFPASPAAGTYLPMRLTDGSNFLTAGTDYTHDAALTVASSGGPLLIGRASAAAPTNVSADDDAVAAWFLRNGSQVVNLAAGGTLIGSSGSSLNMICTSGCSGGVQYAEDTAGADADTLTLAGVERQDTIASNTTTDGDRTYLKVNSAGALYASLSHLGTTALLVGNGATGAGSQRVTISSDNTAFAVNAQPFAATSGGASTASVISAATTNSTSVKGSAGQVYGIHLINTNATVYYLRLYNSAGAPTCSSATGFVESIPIPASTSGAGVVIPMDIGAAYGTGIGYCLTGGASSTDNTSAATGITGGILYK